MSQAKQRQRWKMTAQELMSAPRLIPGNEWSPLDGVPMPEYIPEQWDGPHVGVRLIDGFKTLANMPNRGRHKAVMGFWPETWVEWEDMLAQTGSDKDTQERDAAARNRVRLRPSAQEITRMETVLLWPVTYLASRSALGQSVARVVQVVAFMRSRDLDLNAAARRLKMGSKQLRMVNRTGLDRIAGELRRAREPVF